MIAVLASSLAWGYNWDFSEAPTGSSMTVHLCDGNFGDAKILAIFAAADAWKAGTGEILRGATWSYVRGTDRSAGSCDYGNGYNEIYSRDATWFGDRGLDEAQAWTRNDDVTDSTEVDFVLNSGLTWTATIPSGTPLSEASIGQIALHEFGHGLGFNHNDTFLAVMNSYYPYGGELGGMYRPNEDEYVGIHTERPHSSTGINLLLNKFAFDTSTDLADEVWDSTAGGRWGVCDYLIDPDIDGPEGINAVIYEQSGAVSVEVRWQLSEDITCFSGLEYTVGTRFPSIGSNTPYTVQPTDYDFRGVPAGNYYMCARIDPLGYFSESSESDNDIRSEVQVNVQDCP